MAGQVTEMTGLAGPGAGPAAQPAEPSATIAFTQADLARMIDAAVKVALAHMSAADMAAAQLAAVNMGDAGPNSSKNSVDPKVVDRLAPFTTKDSVQRWGTDAKNMLSLAGQNVDGVAVYLLSGAHKVFDQTTRTSIKLQMQQLSGKGTLMTWDATVPKVTWALLIESMTAAQLGALRTDVEVFIALAQLKGLASRVGVQAAIEQMEVLIAHLSQPAMSELETAQALSDGLKSAYLLQLFPVSMHPMLLMGDSSVPITDFATLYKRVVAHHVLFQAKLDEIAPKSRTAPPPASDAGPASTSSWKEVVRKGGAGRAGKRGADGSDASASKRPRDATQALPSNGPLPTSSSHPKGTWQVRFPQLSEEDRKRLGRTGACFICQKSHPHLQGYPACPEFEAAFRAGRVVYRPVPKN